MTHQVATQYLRFRKAESISWFLRFYYMIDWLYLLHRIIMNAI